MYLLNAQDDLPPVDGYAESYHKPIVSVTLGVYKNRCYIIIF